MLVTTRTSVATGRGEVSYLHAGSGTATLFLHGVPGSAEAWRPVLDGLSPDAGRSVIVPDLLGFGGSRNRSTGIEGLGIDAQADAVIALLAHLDVTSATFVTHDFGGPVALRVFDRRPDLVDALVLSATNAFPDTPIPFPLSSIFWPVVGPLAAAAIFSPASLAAMLRTGAGDGAPKLDRQCYVGGRTQAAAIRTIFEHSLRNLREVYGPLEAVLGRLDVPTAVLWGDHDPFFALEHGRRTADAVGHATFVTLAGAGHFLPAERPEAYLAVLDGFTTELTPGPEADRDSTRAQK